MILLTTALLAHVPKRRNGENGRRDAHQWDLSIGARLTGRGQVRVRRCATGFPANGAGGLECAAGRPAPNTHMPLGRQAEQSNGIAEPPTLQLRALPTSRQPRSHVETMAK
jgi:hypothetical protein